MKNTNSSSKIETRLGQAFKPFPAFISGIIAGSIFTVYGTLNNVNLFKYIEANGRDIIDFYGDLFGVSRDNIKLEDQRYGYFEKLNIRVNPNNLKIDALQGSVCEQAIFEGDELRVSLPPDASQKVDKFKIAEQKINDILEKRTGKIVINSVKDEAVLLEINFLSEKPSCRRKTPDIQQLEQLLKEGKWQSADQKTYDILLKVANRKTEGNLNREALKNFSCSELETLNQLWSENSGGRFGFQIQQEIYSEIGNSLDQGLLTKYDPDLYIQFNDLVRWIETQPNSKETWKPNDKLLYSLDAPRGHLPRLSQLEDGLELERGYQLISPNALKLSSQEIEARNLFYARIKACDL